MNKFVFLSLTEMKGFRIRPEVRWYGIFYELNSRDFIALDLMYKNFTYNNRHDFGFDCIDGNCEFFRSMDVQVEREVIASRIKYGYSDVFRNFLHFEVFSGIGVRWIEATYGDLPEEAEVVSDNRFGLGRITKENRILPDVALGIRCGLAFFDRD